MIDKAYAHRILCNIFGTVDVGRNAPETPTEF